MKKHSFTLAILSVLLHVASADAQTKGVGRTLQLRSVRLYEAGVGYFERAGRLHVGSGLALPVPRSHLDDALKTLVVLSQDGASVTGIEFASTVSAEMGRALAGLPPGAAAATTYADVLRGMKGSSVEVKTGRETLRGRLLEVVPPDQATEEKCVAEVRPAGDAARDPSGERQPCTPKKQLTVIVVTDDGAVHKLGSAELVSVRAVDPAAAARIGSGLDAVSVGSARAQTSLHVLARGGSNVGIGYVAETPVWRATYRIVLGASDRAMLQAWALLHNDTDEDWKGVRVELVNGRPDSFLFPLAAPRYARRDLVTPDEPLSTVPQLVGRTVDDMWENAAGEAFGAGGLALSGIGEGGGGRGEGIGLGRVGTTGHGSGSGGDGASASNLLSVGNLAGTEEAEGVESGALFRYSIKAPIDLRAHGSALVPFVHQEVTARRIAFFSAPGVGARSAARVTNDTAQTLPAGTVAFFADGGFAGEARLDRMKPRETRFVSFGNDLDVELNVLSQSAEEEPRMLEYAHGVLVEHYVRRRKVDYSVTNQSSTARTVVLALDVVHNSRVEGADHLDFDAVSGQALAVFEAEARSARTRTLHLEEGLRREHPRATLASSTLRALGASTKLPANQRAMARAAADLLASAESRREALPKLARAIEQVETDAARLRTHVGAARGADQAASELVERLLHEEDRLRALRARAALLEVEANELTRKAHERLEQLAR